jgi:hypothetical protein
MSNNMVVVFGTSYSLTGMYDNLLEQKQQGGVALRLLPS